MHPLSQGNYLLCCRGTIRWTSCCDLDNELIFLIDPKQDLAVKKDRDFLYIMSLEIPEFPN